MAKMQVCRGEEPQRRALLREVSYTPEVGGKWPKNYKKIYPNKIYAIKEECEKVYT
jgi:hypothetical protein